MQGGCGRLVPSLGTQTLSTYSLPFTFAVVFMRRTDDMVYTRLRRSPEAQYMHAQ